MPVHCTPLKGLFRFSWKDYPSSSGRPGPRDTLSVRVYIQVEEVQRKKMCFHAPLRIRASARAPFQDSCETAGTILSSHLSVSRFLGSNQKNESAELIARRLLCLRARTQDKKTGRAPVSGFLRGVRCCIPSVLCTNNTARCTPGSW